jgi:hypothetical protein
MPHSDSVVTIDRAQGVQSGLAAHQPNEQSYDLAALRLDDNGELMDPAELEAIEDCIARARSNPNGAVVVLFVHGWHHSADWRRTDDTGDEHFRKFRTLLMALTLREAERYFGGPNGSGRRVVGIYVGWNGDPLDSWIPASDLTTNFSFWNRYSVARRIGDGDPFRDALRRIVAATKGPLPPGTVASDLTVPTSPLVLMGHSMGALILESAFLALLKAGVLVYPASGVQSAVEVRRNGQRVSFPDVVIALNSAADSTIHREIRAQLEAQGITKSVQAGGIGYDPPLLISATSVADNDTRIVWRAANLPWIGRRTDGHDPELMTHTFTLMQPTSICIPFSSINSTQAVDFNQAWHCVRGPFDQPARRPGFAIDLPTRDRVDGERDLPFARYRLSPLGDPQKAETTWVFQLPAALVADHNDIFNAKARELMIGLMQISGAVMSLAQEWKDTFEPEAV